MTGTSAVLPVGTIIAGSLDEDVPVAFAAGAMPAPLIAVAAAPSVAASLPQPPKATDAKAK